MFSQPFLPQEQQQKKEQTTEQQFSFTVSVLKRAIHAFQSTSSETVEFDYNDCDDNIEKFLLQTVGHWEWAYMRKCITKFLWISAFVGTLCTITINSITLLLQYTSSTPSVCFQIYSNIKAIHSCSQTSRYESLAYWLVSENIKQNRSSHTFSDKSTFVNQLTHCTALS